MAWWFSSALFRETSAQLCVVVLEAVSAGITSVRRGNNTTDEALNGAKFSSGVRVVIVCSYSPLLWAQQSVCPHQPAKSSDLRCLRVLQQTESKRRKVKTRLQCIVGVFCNAFIELCGSTHQSSHGQNILDASYDESSVLFAQKSLQFNSAFLSKIKALLYWGWLLLWNMWLKALLTCSVIFFEV